MLRRLAPVTRSHSVRRWRSYQLLHLLVAVSLVLSLFPPPTPAFAQAAGGELIADGGFEQDVSIFWYSRNSVSRIGDARSGSYGLRFSPAPGDGLGLISAYGVPVQPNTTYTFSVWAKRSSQEVERAVEMELGLDLVEPDPNGGTLKAYRFTGVEFNVGQDVLSYRRYIHTFTTSATTTDVAIWVNGSYGFDSLIIDDLSLAPSSGSCASIAPTACGQVGVSLPYRLDWSGGSGGLPASNGRGTGFTMADPPSARLSADGAPSSPSAPGYEPSKLALDTTAGVLRLTSTKGLAFRDPSVSAGTNSQLNALGVGFGAAQPLRLRTTLLQPNVGPSADTFAQQAGLWFGLNENNYVKLVLVKRATGAPQVQLAVEAYGAASTGPRPLELNSAALSGVESQALELELELDPAAGVARGYYRMGSGARVAVSEGGVSSLAVPAAFFAGADHDASASTPALSYGGIFTSHRNAAQPITVAFDRFAVELLNSPAPTGTATSVPPTATATATSVPPTTTPTATSVPPTATATATSVPPSPTPTGGNAAPCATRSTLPCDQIGVSLPYRLDWSGSEGGLADSAGRGTGFTMADPPSARLSADGAPSSPSAPGYEPSKLALDTTAGVLRLTSTKGLAFRDPSVSANTNSQLNALGVGFDASEPLRLRTTLLQPNVGPSADTFAQQAGLWFGLNENNYVKLVLVKRATGAPQVQLAVEAYGAASTGPRPLELNSAALSGVESQALELELELDPATRVARGYYRVGGGARTPVSEGGVSSLAVPAAFFAGADHDASASTPALSYGGIFTSHRNAAQPITIAFDQFAVEREELLSISASPANLAEEGGATGSFTVTRKGETADALTVDLFVFGTATSGEDYAALPAQLTISAGASSATLTVTPTDDSAPEGDETVTVALVGRNDALAATLAIVDNEPSLSLSTPDTVAVGSAGLGADPASFRIVRGGDRSAPLTFSYTLGGEAVNGVDYVQLQLTATIPAGSPGITLLVNPFDDGKVGPNKIVTLTLAESPSYTIVSELNADVLIRDEDPVVALVASDTTAAEAGAGGGTFVISRTGNLSKPLTVRYDIGGGAVNGIDYAQIADSLTIPAGAASARVAITPVDDASGDAGESVLLKLLPDPAYTLAAEREAEVKIADNEPMVGVAASSATATEAGIAATFTITRSGDLSLTRVVPYIVGGTAFNGEDYTRIPAAATIPAGAASVTVQVRPLDDTRAEGRESVTLTLVGDQQSVAAHKAVAWIEDNEPNRPPVASGIQLTLTHNTGIPTWGSIDLNAAAVCEPDNQQLSFALRSQPTSGTTRLVGSTLYYTPTAGFTGADALTFSADDGKGGTVQGTLNITVRNAPDENQPPSADYRTVTISQAGQPISIDLRTLSGDPEGDALSYTIDGLTDIPFPTYGPLSLTGSTLTYTPTEVFTGTDLVAFGAVDAQGRVGAAEIAFAFAATLDGPAADYRNVSVPVNQSASVDLRTLVHNAGAAPTFTLGTVEVSGTVSLNNGVLSYTPPAGFVGVASVPYTVTDAAGKSAQSEVLFNVTAPYVAPEASGSQPVYLELSPASAFLQGVGTSQTFTLRAYNLARQEVPVPASVQWLVASRDEAEGVTFSVDPQNPARVTVTAAAEVGYLQLKAQACGVRSGSLVVMAGELQPGVTVISQEALVEPIGLHLDTALEDLLINRTAEQIQAWIDSYQPDPNEPIRFETVIDAARAGASMTPGMLFTSVGPEPLAGRVVETTVEAAGTRIIYETVAITDVIRRAELQGVFGVEDIDFTRGGGADGFTAQSAGAGQLALGGPELLKTRFGGKLARIALPKPVTNEVAPPGPARPSLDEVNNFGLPRVDGETEAVVQRFRLPVPFVLRRFDANSKATGPSGEKDTPALGVSQQRDTSLLGIIGGPGSQNVVYVEVVFKHEYVYRIRVDSNSTGSTKVERFESRWIETTVAVGVDSTSPTGDFGPYIAFAVMDFTYQVPLLRVPAFPPAGVDLLFVAQVYVYVYYGRSGKANVSVAVSNRMGEWSFKPSSLDEIVTLTPSTTTGVNDSDLEYGGGPNFGIGVLVGVPDIRRYKKVVEDRLKAARQGRAWSDRAISILDQAIGLALPDMTAGVKLEFNFPYLYAKHKTDRANTNNDTHVFGYSGVGVRIWIEPTGGLFEAAQRGRSLGTALDARAFDFTWSFVPWLDLRYLEGYPVGAGSFPVGDNFSAALDDRIIGDNVIQVPLDGKVARLYQLDERAARSASAPAILDFVDNIFNHQIASIEPRIVARTIRQDDDTCRPQKVFETVNGAISTQTLGDPNLDPLEGYLWRWDTQGYPPGDYVLRTFTKPVEGSLPLPLSGPDSRLYLIKDLGPQFTFNNNFESWPGPDTNYERLFQARDSMSLANTDTFTVTIGAPCITARDDAFRVTANGARYTLDVLYNDLPSANALEITSISSSPDLPDERPLISSVSTAQGGFADLVYKVAQVGPATQLSERRFELRLKLKPLSIEYVPPVIKDCSAEPREDTLYYRIADRTSYSAEPTYTIAKVRIILEPQTEGCDNSGGGGGGDGGDGGGSGAPLGSAGIWGDPHIYTPDGVSYDSHALGEFIYARPRAGQSGLTLQVRQELISLTAFPAIATAMAAKAGDQVVEIHTKPSLQVLIDGQPFTGAYADLGGGASFSTSGSMAWLRAPSGALSVRMGSGYLDISASLPLDGSLEGMFGIPNGDRADDMRLPDGSPTSDPFALADGWRITSRSASLFTYAPGEGPETYNKVNANMGQLPSPAEFQPYQDQARALLTNTCAPTDSGPGQALIDALALDLYIGIAPTGVASQLCSYEVSGLITSSATGQPLPGVTVSLTSGQLQPCTAVTDATGRYRCELAPNPGGGAPTVSVSVLGTPPVSLTFPAKAPQGGSLAATQDLTSIIPVLRLTVVTVDPTGAPLPDATINLFSQYSPNPRSLVTTGANGRTVTELIYPANTASTYISAYATAGSFSGNSSSSSLNVTLESDGLTEATLTLTALRLGTPRWSLDSTTDNGPMVSNTVAAVGADGTIYTIAYGYIPNGDHYFVRATNPNGNLRWISPVRFDKPEGDTWAVVAGANALYVSSNAYENSASYGVLYALNPADGSQRWRFTSPPGQSYVSKPAVAADGTIYVVMADYQNGGTLYAIDPATGQTIAGRSVNLAARGYDVKSPIVAPDGTIYVEGGNQMSAIRDGAVRWSYSYNRTCDGRPSLAADGTIYVGLSCLSGDSSSTRLIALNPDGTLRWNGSVGTDYPPVVGSDGTLYVYGSRGLSALNPADGTVRWSYGTPGVQTNEPRTVPLLGADGLIYVGTSTSLEFGGGGNLAALSPTGQLVRSFITEGSIDQYLTMGPDGTVYVATSNDELMAIPTQAGGLAASPWPAIYHDSRNTGRAVAR